MSSVFSLALNSHFIWLHYKLTASVPPYLSSLNLGYFHSASLAVMGALPCIALFCVFAQFCTSVKICLFTRFPGSFENLSSCELIYTACVSHISHNKDNTLF